MTGGNERVAPETLVFTVFEEALMAIARYMGPWTVQFEVAAAGRLDAERLERAITEACLHHPLAGARTRALPRGDRAYRWLIRGGLDVDPLIVVDCPDDAALAALRNTLYSAPIDLDLAPPLRVVLARRPGGDLVLFSVTHVASDGVGCLRLLQTVTRAYRGEKEPPAAVGVPEARGLEDRLSAGAWHERARLAGEVVRRLRESLHPPVRVAAHGGTKRAGYDFVTRTLDAERTRALLEHRPAGASLNDLAVTAVVLAIDDWNAAHGLPGDRIAVSMPVNTRPQEWFWDIVGNFASFVTISVRRAQRADAASALAAVKAQTHPVARGRQADALLGFLRLLRPAPVNLERFVAARLAGSRFVDTVVLSNLGRLPDPPHFDDNDAPEVWFSPPAAMPIGLGIGLATSGEVLRISFRYSPRRFDEAAAQAFADLYVEHLEGLAGASIPESGA